MASENKMYVIISFIKIVLFKQITIQCKDIKIKKELENQMND